MSQTAVIPQFSYHKWPDGQAPLLKYRSRAAPQLSRSSPRQLIPQYDLASTEANWSTLHRRISTTAPLPFVYDSLNSDYFAYEPETTCFVYSRFGRIHFDAAKRQHYRPDVAQQLKFARTPPTWRVYESGEVMFWDSRREDWYRYDMQNRRIVWRDGRWWPFPHKFSVPTLAGYCKARPVRNVQVPTDAVRMTPLLHRVLPVDAPKNNHLAEQKKRSYTASKEPYVVKVVPDWASKGQHDTRSKALHVPTKKRMEKTSDTKEGYVVISANSPCHHNSVGERSHNRYRESKARIYGLDDLVANCMRKDF